MASEVFLLFVLLICLSAQVMISGPRNGEMFLTGSRVLPKLKNNRGMDKHSFGPSLPTSFSEFLSKDMDTNKVVRQK